MQIAKNTVVSIRYTLTDDAGALIDESGAAGPLTYLHGRQEIVPGLERALDGKQTGDKLSVAVAPEEGYGAYDERLTLEVPRSALPPELETEVGQMLVLGDDDGREFPVTILEAGPTSLTLDRNHPLAGKTLHFTIEVEGVRAAKEDELSPCCVAGTCGS